MDREERDRAVLFGEVRRGEEARRVIGVHHPQLVEHVEDRGLEGAVTTLLEAGLGLFDARVLTLVEVNAQEAPGLLRGLDHRMGVLDGGGGGLGHYHVQTGFKGGHGRRAMQVVGGIDLDGVEFDLGQQVAVIGEAARGGDAGEVGEPIAVLLVGVGDGADVEQVRVMAVEVEVLVDFAHDGARAYYTQPEFGFHVRVGWRV